MVKKAGQMPERGVLVDKSWAELMTTWKENFAERKSRGKVTGVKRKTATKTSKKSVKKTKKSKKSPQKKTKSVKRQTQLIPESKYSKPKASLSGDSADFLTWLKWGKNVWQDQTEKRQARLAAVLEATPATMTGFVTTRLVKKKAPSSSVRKTGQLTEDCDLNGWSRKEPPAPHTGFKPLRDTHTLRRYLVLWDFMNRYRELLNVTTVFTFDSFVEAMHSTTGERLVLDQLLTGCTKLVCTPDVRAKDYNPTDPNMAPRRVVNILTWQENLRLWLLKQINDGELSGYEYMATLLQEESFYVATARQRLEFLSMLVAHTLRCPELKMFVDHGWKKILHLKTQNRKKLDKLSKDALKQTDKMSEVARCLSSMIGKVESSITEEVKEPEDTMALVLHTQAVFRSKTRTSKEGLAAWGKSQLREKVATEKVAAKQALDALTVKFGHKSPLLGQDRYFNNYFWFGNGTGNGARVFVEVQNTTEQENVVGYYDSPEQLKQLAAFCNTKGRRESALKQQVLACLDQIKFVNVPQKSGQHGFVEAQVNSAKYSWRNLMSECKATFRAQKVLAHGMPADEKRCDGCQDSYQEASEFHCPFCHTVISKIKKVSSTRITSEVDSHVQECRANPSSGLSSEHEENLKQQRIERIQVLDVAEKTSDANAMDTTEDGESASSSSAVVYEVKEDRLKGRWWLPSGNLSNDVFQGSSYFQAMSVLEVSEFFKTMKACIMDIESAIPVESVKQNKKGKREKWIHAIKTCYSLPGLCELVNELLLNIDPNWMRPWFAVELPDLIAGLNTIKTDSQLAVTVFRLDRGLAYTWEDKHQVNQAELQTAAASFAVTGGCETCGKGDRPDELLICDECDESYHMSCLKPKLHRIPRGDWFCPKCKERANKKARDASRKKRRASRRTQDSSSSEDSSDEDSSEASSSAAEDSDSDASMDSGSDSDSSDEDSSDEDSSEESSSEEEEEEETCTVCATDGKAIVSCSRCANAAHKACLGLSLTPRNYTCDNCAAGIESVDCVLCPSKEGYVQQITKSGSEFDGKTAHLSCALFIDGVKFGDMKRRTPITHVNQVELTRFTEICNVCHATDGACVTCSERRCTTTFHVTCALGEVGRDLGHTASVGKLRKGKKPSASLYCPNHGKK